MKVDPWKHKEKYTAWKEKLGETGIQNISKENSDLILQYVFDMEDGINIAQGSIRGPRGYGRLLSLKHRMIFFSKNFKKLYNLDNVTKINI